MVEKKEGCDLNLIKEITSNILRKLPMEKPRININFN